MELDILINRPIVELPVLSPEDSAKISKVRELWLKWRNWWDSNHGSRIRENYRRYHAVKEAYEDVEDNWRGVNGEPLRMALEYAVVETYKTRIIKAIISNNMDFFRILPTKQTTVRNAELMDKVVHFMINNDETVKALMIFVDQACRNGSCPWLVYQKQKTKLKKVVVNGSEPIKAYGLELGAKPVETEELRPDIVENIPVFKPYDIETVAFNASIQDYDSSPFYIFRQIVHRSILAQLFPEMKDLLESGRLDWDKANDIVSDRMGSRGITSDQTNNEGMVEVYYYMEPDGTYIVFGDKLIKWFPNESELKEVHTGMLSILPEPWEVYGKDLIQLTAQFADIFNELMNIDIDSTKISSSLTYKAKANAGVEFNTIFQAPGNIMIMDDLSAVEPVPQTYTPGSAMRPLEYLSSKDQQITGATYANTGTPVDAKFSSDIQRMVAESNYKFWLVIAYVKLELKKILRAYVLHVQEFIAPNVKDKPFIYRLEGKDGGFDFGEINNPDDLMGDFDYAISLNTDDIDTNLVRAQLIQAITAIMGNQSFSSIITPEILLRELLKTFPTIKSLDGLIKKPGEQLITLIQQLDEGQLMFVMQQINAQLQAKKPGVEGAPAETPAPAAQSTGAIPPVVSTNQQVVAKGLPVNPVAGGGV